MDTFINGSRTERRRFFLSGELVEVWENPDVPFHCAPDHFETYAQAGEWVRLFNAMMLVASPGAEQLRN